jgi:hypothetical protein
LGAAALAAPALISAAADAVAAASTFPGSPYTGLFEKKNLIPRKISDGLVNTSFAILRKSAGSTKPRTVQCTG